MPGENEAGQGITPPSQPPQTSAEIAATSPDNTDWERKFYGIRGTLKASQATAQTREGEFQQQVADLKRELAEVKQANTSMAEENAALATQVGQLDELKAQADQLPIVQAQEEKLRMIMEYPELTQATKVVVTKDEAGNDVETRENPYLTLAMTSTLKGTDFRAMLQGLSEVVPATSEPAVAPAPLAGSTPGSVPQTPGDTVEDLRRQRNEASIAHNYAEVSRLNDAIMAQQK
jgi:regulator of replication initiation timing